MNLTVASKQKTVPTHTSAPEQEQGSPAESPCGVDHLFDRQLHALIVGTRPQIVPLSRKVAGVSGTLNLIPESVTVKPASSPPAITQSNPETTELRSDVTLQELHELSQNPQIKQIIILFHADGCKPCKPMETADYQQAIESHNAAGKGTYIVTLNVGELDWPAMKMFWLDGVGIEPWPPHADPTRQRMTAIIPKVLYWNVQNNRYDTSVFVVSNAETTDYKSVYDLLQAVQQIDFKKEDARQFPNLANILSQETP